MRFESRRTTSQSCNAGSQAFERDDKQYGKHWQRLQNSFGNCAKKTAGAAKGGRHSLAQHSNECDDDYTRLGLDWAITATGFSVSTLHAAVLMTKRATEAKTSFRE
jgi:hypothetical protein